MKYYSETLKKFYDTPDECKKEENKYLAELKAKEIAEKKKSDERAARAKEVENALQAVKEARAKYNDLLNKFCKDYGSFHCSFDSKEPNALSIFDFLNWF